MRFVFGVLFIIAAFFEANIAQYPLWISLFTIIVVAYRPEVAFLVSILGGILLDVLLVRPLGGSGLFGMCVALACVTYSKKYHVQSFPFVVIASMVITLLYCLVFAVPLVLLKVLAVGFTSLPIYFIYVTAKLNDWV